MTSRSIIFLIYLIITTVTFVSNLAAEVAAIPFQGKKIRKIVVQVNDIFEEDDLNWLYRKANELKYKTHEKVILRELTFKPGMELTNFHITESSRNVRSLNFIRQVEIQPLLVDEQTIDVLVEVLDTWTLIPQLSYSSGDGRNKRSFGIGESDLFGLGKRLEFLVEDDDGRKTTQTVYDDRRFLGTANQLELANFDRTDGQIQSFSLERPFRTLFDQQSYGVSLRHGDTAERLFRNSEERFVYREKDTNFDIFYTLTKGQPEIQSRRYSLGFNYLEDNFEEAELEDYEDIGVDINDPNLEDVTLADDRRYVGPYLAYEAVVPEYISRNYIDRFGRYDDYNLGAQTSAKMQFATEALGSLDDAVLFSLSHAAGWSLSKDEFFRAEIGFGSRYISEASTLQNSIFRTDLRYYNILGQQKLGGLNLGSHTLAGAFSVDYANKLDRDQEFLLGADNFLRGYSARTFSGDKRVSLNLEDRIHWVEDVWKLFDIGSVFFLDVGTATSDSLDRAIQDQIFSDIGFGLRLGLPRSSGSRVLRFDVAFPMRDGPDDTKAYDPRFIFSASQAFDSFLRTEIIQKSRATVDTGF